MFFAGAIGKNRCSVVLVSLLAKTTENDMLKLA